MKILIADDSISTRFLLENLVSEWGYEPVLAGDGEEAWNILQQEDGPRIALIDWMMPVLDGVEVCQRLKEVESQFTYIILVTSKRDKEDIITGLDAGADDFLSKPVQPDELRSRLSVGMRILGYQDALEESRNELSKQNDELKKMQTQLVHAGKMAGLGTLVAGVAHEINNPTNFTYVGAQNLLRKLKQFQEFLFELAGEDAEEEIKQAFTQRFDDLFSELDAISEGSQRIRGIVTNLRTFSRLDEAEQKQAALVEGIISTLKLVKPNYKQEVQFITHFNDDPVLECWPAQLNQVFMNIMINACQAIVAKQKKNNDGTPGTLTITTQQKGNELYIIFVDTGEGIDNEVKENIFEPFFTTKPVGLGTGLGLSVSFSVIQKHQGKIIVDSEKEVGTTMTIILPLHLTKQELK